MATYKVKPSDNYSKIAEQYQVPVSTLVKLNRQAPLSAGMTIKVPKQARPFNATPPTFQYGLMNWGITQPQTQGSFVSGSGGVNLQKVDLGLSAFPRSQGPLINSTQQPQTLAQGSFVSGSGGVNLQGQTPTLGGRGTMLPTAADFQTIGSVLGPQPTGTYTGGNSANDQAWRDLWNQQAANGDTHNNGEFPGFWGGGKNGGFFKTLREARMATRRKRINEEEQDMGRPVYSPQAEVKPVLGERQQTVTWNVGG